MYNKYFTMKKSELKEAIKSEIKSVLSEDINEIEFRPNTGLAQIKDQGEVDGADAITKELRQYNLKNVPDMDAYADGFVKGAANKAMFYKDKLDQAIRGGGDNETLMGLVGLKEGTWSSGTYNEIGRFIQDVKNLKDKYYDIVGNDDVFDGLDRAEEAAREMMINAPENRSDLNEDEPEDDMHDDPGDIRIENGNSKFYFPLTTSLLVSAVLSLLMYFFRK